jgi:hypothetical protein
MQDSLTPYLTSATGLPRHANVDNTVVPMMRAERLQPAWYERAKREAFAAEIEDLLVL